MILRLRSSEKVDREAGVGGAGFEPATLGLGGQLEFCLSLSRDAFCTGEMRRQELSGSVQSISLREAGHQGRASSGVEDEVHAVDTASSAASPISGSGST